MKKSLLTTVLIVAICMFSLGNKIVATGQSNTAFGEYKIVQLDDHMMFKNKELDKYLITYAKSDIKVVVAIDKQKKCKKYYVLVDKLPVQYECNGNYFGIKKLDKDLYSSGFVTSVEMLNKDEFYHQKVLTTEATSTMDQLNLIASYYPGLFNEKIS